MTFFRRVVYIYARACLGDYNDTRAAFMCARAAATSLDFHVTNFGAVTLVELQRNVYATG